jgi:hypothetical protein
MTRLRTTSTLLTACACLSVTTMLAGCLERIETITVSEDRSLTLSSEFRGTPEDFAKQNDALPENGGAWAITERTEKDADGKPRVVRVASLNVGKGGEIPSSYAAAGDARGETGLRFPTTLKVSTVGPYTYYEFTRTYPKREEARFRYDEKRLTETDAFRKIKETDPAKMTDEQRAALVRTMVMVEAYKSTVYIEQAAAPLEGDGTWPQEIGLVLRQSVLAFAEQFKIDGALAALTQADESTRGAAIQREAEALRAGLRQSVHDAMQTLALPEAQQERFVAAAKRAIAVRHATEDLSDERWEVRVKLPGVVGASNADKLENGVLVWEFAAPAFLDRDHVLKATSHVEVGK